MHFVPFDYMIKLNLHYLILIAEPFNHIINKLMSN